MLEVISNPYKSIVVLDEEGVELVVSEGNRATFTVESTGEVKAGVVEGFTGKDDKLEIEITPDKGEHKEKWCVSTMEEGSLRLQ